jgi:hypothetical protein
MLQFFTEEKEREIILELKKEDEIYVVGEKP